MSRKLSDSLYRAGVGALALAVAVLVLASSVELHDSNRQHATLASPTEIAVDARHAGSAAHFERSEIVLVSHCPECLLRSQSVGKVAAPLLTALDAVTLQRLLGFPDDTPPLSDRGGPVSSRAPPVS